MKTLVALVVLIILALPGHAQLPPTIRLDVQMISKKNADRSGKGFTQSRALHITVFNYGSKPINGITLRWGVIKNRTANTGSSSSTTGNLTVTSYYFSKSPAVAYGATESFDLDRSQTKVIDTPPIEASGAYWTTTPNVSKTGEKILGHGAQILLEGKVMIDQVTPASYRPLFDDLQPLSAAASRETSADRGATTTKKKRK